MKDKAGRPRGAASAAGIRSLLLVVICGVLFLPSGLFALEHEVVYLDGYPYATDRYGDETDLQIGDAVSTGDTVITKSGDYVELEANGYTVKIEENTVFAIQEIEQEGQKNDVLACVLGKLSFSRDKFLGTEPQLRTSSAICGVRGMA